VCEVFKLVGPHKSGVEKISLKPRVKIKENNNVSDSSSKKSEKEKIGDSKIKCFYINVRSIVNKLDKLAIYLEEEKPDIVGITETWLHDDIVTVN
jgi:hypothetical protein